MSWYFKKKLKYLSCFVWSGLKTRRRKAQQKNDLAEESKLCNAIGEVYMRKGNDHTVKPTCIHNIQHA